MRDSRRTKIVATTGPAMWQPGALETIIRAGVDVVRLNFSHADYDHFRELVTEIRSIAAGLGRPVAILGDLQGPKIRTGRLKGGGPVMLEEGAECVITTQQIEGTAERFSTGYSDLARDVKPGEKILLSDGTRELEVIDKTDTELRCKVIVGGLLNQHQGINLPGTRISAPAITEKDAADLEFCLEQKVDMVALSFVRSADDIIELRRRIAGRCLDMPIIAKIEKPQALEHIAAIMDVTDGIMVARGDLGVEMPAERVPLEQKHLIAMCNHLGKPVITATQMLESMVDNPRPTRAEASDVANAIFDGTDAVMLSAETAIGKHPAEAVATMGRIACAVEEASFSDGYNRGEWRRHHDLDISRYVAPPETSVEAAIADAANGASCELDADAIVVCTISGSTARKIARRRPAAPILALTPRTETYNRLALVWGVHPLQMEFGEQSDAIIETGKRLLVESGWLKQGDRVVIVSGALPAIGATNLIKIHEIDFA